MLQNVLECERAKVKQLSRSNVVDKNDEEKDIKTIKSFLIERLEKEARNKDSVSKSQLGKQIEML